MSIREKLSRRFPLGKLGRCRLFKSIVMLGIFVGSVLWDVSFRATSLWPWVVSPSTYIDVMFAALCTVATMGSATQSIIVGALGNRFYGFTAREILAAKPEEIDIVLTVMQSFIAIGFGVFALLRQLPTAITVLLLYTVYIIAGSSAKI